MSPWMRDNLGNAWPSWPTGTTEGVTRVSEMFWLKSSYSGGSGSDCVEVAWRKSSYSNGEGTSCVEVAWRKSSHSNGEGSSCVEVAWRKSSHSNGSGSSCVEVAWRNGQALSVSHAVLVRDSKNPTGPTLT